MQSQTEQRTYHLTPANDTELLSILTEMPLELVSILCDVMAMEESVKLLVNQTNHHNISAIISEEVKTETSVSLLF